MALIVGTWRDGSKIMSEVLLDKAEMDALSRKALVIPTDMAGLPISAGPIYFPHSGLSITWEVITLATIEETSSPCSSPPPPPSASTP